ncbi:MAG TPA: trehalose-phosphatase [Actinomycetota bacterium]
MSLEEVRARLAAAAIALDFDGTLAPIVARPEDARPLPGIAEALGALVPRVRRLAVVTGRPTAFVRAHLPVDGVEIFGLYGLEGMPPLPDAVVDAVRDVAATEPGASLEHKRSTVAVHVRGTADPDGAEARLRPLLAAIAGRAGLALLAGKRVLELAPPGGGKGAAVLEVAGDAEAVLVAGDDLADLDAFVALDGLDAVVCRVAVLGLETPEELRLRADLVVDGPEGLLELLRSLV